MTEPAQPHVQVIPEALGLPHRLGRHLHHDERSRAFAFSAPAEVQLKPVRWERAVPIFDQGDLGSCTGNAAAGWLGTANALRPGLTTAPDPFFPGAPPLPVDEALAVDIYRWNTRNDPYDGTFEPDDTGSDGLTAAKALQRMGAADSYQHAFDVPSVLAALQSGPVLIGTVWFEGMFTARAHGLVEISETIVGGHEYLAVGYEPAGSGPVLASDVVVFANSWGPGWGEDGYFRMTVDTLWVLLGNDGDATIPHALVTAPPPAPGPVASFPVVLDPDVAAHVVRTAAHRGVEPSVYVNDRLRRYFD